MPKSGKHAQFQREALVTLGLYGIFFVWWFCWGYGLGLGDPSTYLYILGLPLWFFMSCVVGWLGISLGVFWGVRRYFREFPLEETNP